MTIDDELRRASDDLRRELRTVSPPSLGRPMATNRAGFAVRSLVIGASVAVFIVAGVLVLGRGPGEDGSTGIASTDGEDSTAVDPVEVDRVDLVTTIDPTYGTLLTEVPTPAEAGQAVLPLPGGAPAWNADGSLLLLYEVGIDGGGHALYDGRDLERIGRLGVEPVDVEQLYWDPVDPDLLHYVDGVELVEYTVSTGVSVATHRFEGCDAVNTRFTAMPFSNDGGRIGVVCEKPDGVDLVALDLDTGREIRRPGRSVGTGPVPTPDGSGWVVQGAGGRVEVFDEQFEPTGIVLTVGSDLFVLIETADGRQLYVTTIFSQPAEAVGSVVGFDLTTGEAIVAIGEAVGDPYPPAGTQLAASVAGRSRVVVTILGDPTIASPDTLDGKVFLVDFDPAEPTVTPIASHEATILGHDLDLYWSRPYAAVDVEGRRVLFSSDRGRDRVTPVVADVER